jgi:hypothetical protein
MNNSNHLKERWLNMSSEIFIHVAKGKSARAAFNAAVEQAAYEHGHAGYTGTIAEKDNFIEIPLPKTGRKDPERRAEALANKLIEKNDPRIDDKWGPAGCIKIGPGKYLFFGWASS